MKAVSEREIAERIRVENPWWKTKTIDPAMQSFRKRKYFDLFFPYVVETDPRRALILMGPRRVGKTVMLHQSIRDLIDAGVDPKRICYLDLQTPLYNGISLEKLVELFHLAVKRGLREAGSVVFFDEIQYLPRWEVHLKNLVDKHPNTKFIASGSAAAALRLKSVESGAGRFTDFLLPPVTFYEYLDLLEADSDLVNCAYDKNGNGTLYWNDIQALNNHFVSYVNMGGYPEAIFSANVRADPGRYIRGDIIDKVLMKDLPSLYGIHDIQELNALFTMLAYNTAGEVSLDTLAKNAGITKNTIKRYIEYLESTFLIKVVHRIDRSAKQFKRANYFKVYLTNPCIRSALFSPVGADDDDMGSLVETAVFSQWFHSIRHNLYYARWDGGAGEVDLVHLEQPTLKPNWALEVKWSDRYVKDVDELKSLRKFLERHPQCRGMVTTRTVDIDATLNHRTVRAYPSSAYCYWVGWLIIEMKADSTLDVSLLSP